MNLPDLPPADFLQVDLFPAKVSGPSVGALDRVRFVVTNAHVHIFGLTGVGDIDLKHTAELGSAVRALEVGVRGVRVVTAAGDVIEASKSLNCGCGMTRLKTAKLFNPILALQALPL
jgi:hypothetical protein